jgi:hypothetical protein
MGTGMNEQDSGFVEMLHDMGLSRTMLCDVMTRMGYERKSMRKWGKASDVKAILASSDEQRGGRDSLLVRV